MVKSFSKRNRNELIKAMKVLWNKNEFLFHWLLVFFLQKEKKYCRNSSSCWNAFSLDTVEMKSDLTGDIDFLDNYSQLNK